MDTTSITLESLSRLFSKGSLNNLQKSSPALDVFCQVSCQRIDSEILPDGHSPHHWDLLQVFFSVTNSLRLWGCICWWHRSWFTWICRTSPYMLYIEKANSVRKDSIHFGSLLSSYSVENAINKHQQPTQRLTIWLSVFWRHCSPRSSTLPKTNSSHLAGGRAPKGFPHLPTPVLQVLLLLVSGRVPEPSSVSYWDPWYLVNGLFHPYKSRLDTSNK